MISHSEELSIFSPKPAHFVFIPNKIHMLLERCAVRDIKRPLILRVRGEVVRGKYGRNKNTADTVCLEWVSARRYRRYRRYRR